MNNIRIVSKEISRDVAGNDKIIWKAAIDCERHFGHPAAVMMRAVLMHSLPSYRVIGLSIRSKRTAAKDHISSFQSAKNIFSTLNGVGSDIQTIIANLRRCVFVPINRQEKTDTTEDKAATSLNDHKPQIQLSLRSNSARKVLASDFETSSVVKIVGGEDIEITTVDPGYTLDLTVYLGFCSGAIAAEDQNIDVQANDFFALPMEDVIKIKSFHSDVEAVAYNVVSSKECDTIHLSVESSLAFSDNIESILRFTFEYALQLFMPLAGYNLTELLEKTQEDQTEDAADVAIESHMLKHSVGVTGLGGRTGNLQGAGLHTVGDLIKRSHQELLQISGIGHKSIDKIRNYLHKVGLRLKEDYRGQ